MRKFGRWIKLFLLAVLVPLWMVAAIIGLVLVAACSVVRFACMKAEQAIQDLIGAALAVLIRAVPK